MNANCTALSAFCELSQFPASDEAGASPALEKGKFKRRDSEHLTEGSRCQAWAEMLTFALSEPHR